MPRGHLQGEPVQPLLLPVPLPVMRPRRPEAPLAAEERRWQTFGAAERASLQLCAALLRDGAAARAAAGALHPRSDGDAVQYAAGRKFCANLRLVYEGDIITLECEV